jgi:hypothetical protein
MKRSKALMGTIDENYARALGLLRAVPGLIPHSHDKNTRDALCLKCQILKFLNEIEKT